MTYILCLKSAAKIVTVGETKLNGFQEAGHMFKGAFDV
jgi:hypothetical protein